MKKQNFTKHLRSLCLLCLMLLLGISNAWGEDIVVSSTALTSVSNGQQVVWGISSSQCVTGFASNWGTISNTQSDWIVFTIETSGDGFYLKYTDGNSTKYIYSSATKKIEGNADNKTLFTIKNKDTNHKSLVYNSTAGYYTYNSSGIRPYTSTAYTDAHLYAVTVKTLTSLAISGTPTKTQYEADESFDPTGLVVTGTYSDESTAPITEGIEWTLDPETLSVGDTSCDVMATVGTISSDVITISGLTVTAAKVLSSIAIGGELTKVTYFAGDKLDFSGLTAIGTYTDKSTADLTSTATWTSNPETLTAATTSVTVKATLGEVETTKEYAVTVNKKTPSIIIANMEIAKTATDIAISAKTIPEDATLTYEVTEGDGTVITLSADNKISAVALGTATIKASFAGNDEYASVNATFTVTVTDASVTTYTFSEFTSDDNVALTDLDGFTITLSKGTGSSKPAWSSSQARLYANGNLTVKAVNAEIKSIVYEYTINANKNGNVPTIDGVTGKTSDGTWNADAKTWTGTDSEVTFSTSGSAGNIGFTKLTITYAKSSKTETSLAWSASEAIVTIDANDNVFPTLTTTPVDLEGVTYESSVSSVATIAEDGIITLIAPGTTTITAKYAGSETYAEAIPASYTLTVNDAPFVPIPAANGYEMVDFTSVYSDVKSDSREVVTYKGTSFKMEFAKPESSSTLTKYYASGTSVRAYTGNTITITGAEDITGIVVDYVDKYVDDKETITGLNTKTVVVTSSKTCRFTSITVVYKNTSKTISANKLATLYLPYSVTIRTAEVGQPQMKAYIAEKVDNSTIELVKLTEGQIPANTGVIVYADVTADTNFELVPTSYTGTQDLSANRLKGVLANTAVNTVTDYDADSYNYYALVKGASAVEFQKAAPTATLKANSAYLVLPASSEAKIKFTFDDDEATGIQTSEVKSEEAELRIYNLSGQLVGEDYKGIVIKNGKKMLNK